VVDAGRGLVCIAAGDFVYALYERVLHGSAPFPSLADAFYLAGCPLIGLSLVLLVRTRTAGRDRVSWIDATIVASGFGLLSWVFLMAPTAGSNDLSWQSRLVALAYPVWDVLFLALLVRLLAGLGARLPALRLLAGAAALWLVYDTIYALVIQYGNYDQGLLIDLPWLLGFILFGATGMHPSMGELTQPAVQPNTRLSRRRLALLTAASLIAPVLLISQTLVTRGRVDGLAIGAASMLLFLLVVLRIVGLVRQVEDQAARLAALASHDELTGMPNRRAWEGELPVARGRGIRRAPARRHHRAGCRGAGAAPRGDPTAPDLLGRSGLLGWPGDLRGAGCPRRPRALPGQRRRPGPDCRHRPERSGVALTRTSPVSWRSRS
jgi:hypothetical protein